MKKLIPLVLLISHAGVALANKEEDMTELKMRQVCIGRYLVEVPESLELSSLGALFGPFIVETVQRGDERELNRIIAERKLLLEQGGPLDEEERNLQGNAGAGKFNDARFQSSETRNGVTILVYEKLFSFNQNYRSPMRQLEAYFNSEGVNFKITGSESSNRIDAAMENIFSLAGNVLPRDNRQIPAGEGFCLDGAFVKGAQIFDNERITGIFRGDGVYSPTLVVKTQTGSSLYPEEEFNWPPEASVREVAGFSGVQALGAIDNGLDATSGYRLSYYSYNEPKSHNDGAEIFLSMDRKGPINDPPFSRDVAYEFWQRMLNSFGAKR